MADSPLPPAADEATGSRLLDAWHDGTLLPSEAARDDRSPDGASIRRTGIGESFVAWRLDAPGTTSLLIRVPWRPPADLARPLRREVAALRQLDLPGLVPLALGVEESADRSPIGLPYVVLTHQEGEILPPTGWTPRHLRAHARALSRLHRRVVPGSGPVRDGPEPWADLTATPRSVLAEAEAEFSRWERDRGDLLAEDGLGPLLEAALSRIAAVEEETGPAPCCVLAHGDLCATNVLWHGPADDPVPAFIDFEWAQGDDPARDLAILGGRVVGGPWYVPYGASARAEFVDAYVTARDLDPDRPADGPDEPAGTLGLRMRAWEAYERTAMLLHLSARLTDGARDGAEARCADAARGGADARRADAARGGADARRADAARGGADARRARARARDMLRRTLAEALAAPLDG